MRLKMFRKVLIITLALSIIIMPESTVIAKSNSVYQTSYSTETTVSNLTRVDSVNYEDIKKTVESKISMLTSIYGVTSLQYALIDNGEIVLSGQSGVNDKINGTKLTDDTMYGIGSVSKIFTATAVMQLVDKGKVNLDAPVVNYIPVFTMADSRYKDITVRMLLNHSAGFMGTTSVNAFLFDDSDSSTYENFLEYLKSSRLKAKPGEFSVYSNDGFTLAELLVERVSGMRFSEYLQKNISEPLGLKNTKTSFDSFDEDKLAKTYILTEKNALPTDNINMIGAGGIYSTASELCQFGKIFMENSEAEILSKSSARLMETKEYLTDLWAKGDSTFEYGLGWDSADTYPFNEYGIQALSKGGDTLLYHGNITVLPKENLAVAVLSSGGSSVYNQLLAQEILLNTLKTKGIIKEIKTAKTFNKPIKAPLPKDLKIYEGYYGLTGGILEVKMKEDGSMTMKNLLASAQGEQKFYYTDNGKFYSPDGSSYVSFIKESNNEIYMFTQGYTNIPGIGQFASAGYQAQKIENNPLTEELKAVWKKRENKNYYIINEKYTSQLYATNSLISKIIMPEGLEGYCVNAAIYDANTAKADYQISGMYGRDLNDITFYMQHGIEYMTVGGYIAISEDALRPLPTDTKFTCKIPEGGFAQWFYIDKTSADKKIKVTIPTGASFAVYDKNGTCKNFSYISGKNTVKLPKDGHIVFISNADTEFTITYVK